RLGSVDGVEQDANTRRVLQFFLDGMRSGAVRVDEESLRIDRSFPIRKVEYLLRGGERNMNHWSGYLTLNGQPLVFALIARAVWAKIAGAATLPDESVPAEFQRLFGPSSAGAAIYAGSLDDVAEHVGELAAVDAFLRGRGLRWQPAAAGDQHFGEEV